MVLCFYQKKSWWSLRRLKDVPGRGLEDLSWKRSWGRFLEDVLRTSPGRRLDNALRKGRRDFHFRSISKTSLRPKIRRFYHVFATSFCRLGKFLFWKMSRQKTYSFHFLKDCYFVTGSPINIWLGIFWETCVAYLKSAVSNFSQNITNVMSIWMSRVAQNSTALKKIDEPL